MEQGLKKKKSEYQSFKDKLKEKYGDEIYLKASTSEIDDLERLEREHYSKKTEQSKQPEKKAKAKPKENDEFESEEFDKEKTLPSGMKVETIKDNDLSYRYSSSQTGSRKGVNYMMFADNEESISSGLYGENRFIVSTKGTVKSDLLKNDIRKAIESNDEMMEEYGDRIDDLLDEVSPEDIVDSAKIWDNMDLVSFIYEHVLDPADIDKVKTPDGLILFDRDKMKKKQGRLISDA